MSSAKQCDRCGTFFANNSDETTAEVKTFDGRKMHVYIDNKSTYIDICPNCTKDFINWWSKKENK